MLNKYECEKGKVIKLLIEEDNTKSRLSSNKTINNAV